jgi:lipid II:glycine glycyltransferase (peptidoglycan interpeptide bridge formation enzyme)
MPSPLGREARELGPGYSVEIDAVDEASWYRILAEFDDASIYQTWGYEHARAGPESISHIVLRKDGDVVAAAQARIAKLPLVGAGIAYVRWGPMWRRKSRDALGDAFRQAIRALRNEYAWRRGLVLRVRPLLFREQCRDLASVLAEEGYATGREAPDRTLRLDLTKTIEELRNGMRPHWRRYLKVAEKNDLEIVAGSDDALFAQFIPIYRELVGRKAFAEPNDIRQFRLAQERLPRDLKMKIMLCKVGGTLCSGLICSAIGNTGIYLYGATSNAGLKSRGSYLLHWRLIEQLKRDGITTYDLHGINPVTNPGTYKFKADLCGSNGADVHFLGRFDSCTSRLSQSCVAVGDGLMGMVRSLKRGAASKPAAAGQSAAPVASSGSDT